MFILLFYCSPVQYLYLLGADKFAPIFLPFSNTSYISLLFHFLLDPFFAASSLVYLLIRSIALVRLVSCHQSMAGPVVADGGTASRDKRQGVVLQLEDWAWG
jgi:hypothetical protein